MSGSTISELVGEVWATAHSAAPVEEKRRRYQVLLSQIDTHYARSEQGSAGQSNEEYAARIRSIIVFLLSECEIEPH